MDYPRSPYFKSRNKREGFNGDRYACFENPSLLSKEIGNTQHKRGIILTSSHFDEVAYHDVGSGAIVFKKNIDFGENGECVKQYGSGWVLPVYFHAFISVFIRRD